MQVAGRLYHHETSCQSQVAVMVLKRDGVICIRVDLSLLNETVKQVTIT